MNTETDFHIKAEFEQAEMRVSRIVASKAKIPLQAATCAALAAHPWDAGGTGDPGESLDKLSRGVLGFRSNPFKYALAPP